MGEIQPAISALEGEENLIAAAQYLVKALETNKNLSSNAWKIMAGLGTQLSTIGSASEDKEILEQPCEIEQLLNKIQEKVMKWEVDRSLIWEHGPGEAFEYLNAVDKARKLTKGIARLNQTERIEERKLLEKARCFLQIAMVRLEEEFRHLLVQSRKPMGAARLSFCSSENDSLDSGSIYSLGDDLDCTGVALEDHIITLVNPYAIPYLKSIANLMFDSNYGRECSRAFINVQNDSLGDCLFILEVETFCIQDQLKMTWSMLNSKIVRWIRAMKIFVRVYLAREKWLSDQMFSDLESVSAVCFAESSKASILQLLKFGEEIAVGPRQPEKLFRILDMYGVLLDLLTYINLLYSGEAGSCVRIKGQDVLRKLGGCAKATFSEFENAVASNVSSNPYPGGGIHHITRYVMNYMKALIDYNETLDAVLKDHEKDDPAVTSYDTTPVGKEDNDLESTSASPLALHIRSLLSSLESNLDEKSKLYKDDALRHLFMMNNIHYMAEKVRSCELGTILGHEWISTHRSKIQRHARNYTRFAWTPVLLFLRDDQLRTDASYPVSRKLRSALQKFYLAFEAVYNSQTGWFVPDSLLREDLRIFLSVKLVPAYRTFIGRFGNSLRHIKHSPDELENFIFDLFEGSARQLSTSHQK